LLIKAKNNMQNIILTPISKAEICKILPDVNITTVEAVLGTMVKEGFVRIIGSGRNTNYMRK
jgi:hypothetical protein